MKDKADFETGIIGAGFSGLAAAARLKNDKRYSFIIFERSTAPGGTWRDNIYPGCACDVPSHLYSFSFAHNPYWSRKYAVQPEILAYLENFVKKNELQSHIHYNTDIVRARFIEDKGYWLLNDRREQSY